MRLSQWTHFACILSQQLKELLVLMLRKLLLTCLALLFGLGAVATAQEAQPPKSSEPGQATRRARLPRGFHAGPRRGRREARGFARKLNLTEDQQKLAQSIRQKYFAATKTHREQLFQLREKRLAGTFTAEDQERAKALRQEMMIAMSGMREESLGVLTPEQRIQLDGLREEHRQRREEMRQRRLERRQNRPNVN